MSNLKEILIHMEMGQEKVRFNKRQLWNYGSALTFWKKLSH